MVWKSNIAVTANDNDSSLEEVTSPKVIEDKENHQKDRRGDSSVIDARSSENYLKDDVVDM